MTVGHVTRGVRLVGLRWASVPRRAWLVVIIVVVWFAGSRMLNGQFTLPLQAAQVTPLHLLLN